MRTFIAFPLPVEIKETLASVQGNLRSCNLDAKWVTPERLHLTLKFLGEVPEAKLEPIREKLNSVAKEFKALSVTLEKFGFFPHERNPRIFFVATDKEEALQKIASHLEEELAQLGFAPEHRFKSHITLARFRSRKNIDCIREKIKELKIEGRFSCQDIVLFKSTLTPSGPIYEEIFKARLTP
jgi:2'-5' RNA ligase